MKILVLYDSFFGNTKKVAETIVSTLGQVHEIEIVKVENASIAQLQNAELLFVGSPTRAFSASPNMTAFLKSLPEKSLSAVKAAVFDTRIAPEDVKPKLIGMAIKWAGYADKKMIKLLQPSGADVVPPGNGFMVSESEGPLKAGELERAVDWANSIVAKIVGN